MRELSLIHRRVLSLTNGFADHGEFPYRKMVNGSNFEINHSPSHSYHIFLQRKNPQENYAFFGSKRRNAIQTKKIYSLQNSAPEEKEINKVKPKEESPHSLENHVNGPDYSNPTLHHDSPTHKNSNSNESLYKTLPHVLLSTLANLAFGYHIGIINGPLDSIASELGFSGDTFIEGFVVSSFLIGAFIGSISGGVLADNLGRKKSFQIEAIPIIIGSLLSGNAHSVLEMSFGRFLTGLGVGAAAGFVPLYISEISPTENRGALCSLCQIGTCMGIIISLVLGIYAETDAFWWRKMFFFGSIPAVILALGMQFALESPRWLVKVGRWEEAEKTIKSLWNSEEEEKALTELRAIGGSEDGEQEVSWKELFSSKHVKVPLIGGSLFALQQFAGINAVLYFSSSNFKNVGIDNPFIPSALIGCFNLVGALIVIQLMDSYGRKNLLKASYGGMAFSMTLLVLPLIFSLPDSTSYSFSIIGALLYVMTFAVGSGPVTGLIIPELCTTAVRAKALSFSLAVHWVCNFLIGQFFLTLVQQFGLVSMYSAFGLVSLFSIAFAEAFVVETKGRSLEQIQAQLRAAPESSDG